MPKALALAPLVLAALAAPSLAAADPAPFVFSPAGPGAGHGAIGLGGKLHIAPPDLYVPIPTFDLQYVRGLTSNLDLRLSLDALIIVNYADLGARLKFGGPSFSFGVTGSLTTIFLLFGTSDGSGAAASFGATPGAFVGFGSDSVQFSLGADVPIFFAAAAVTNLGSASGADTVAVTIRPSAAIEFPVSSSTNLYIQASAFIIPDAERVIGPFLAVGAAF